MGRAITSHDFFKVKSLLAKGLTTREVMEETGRSKTVINKIRNSSSLKAYKARYCGSHSKPAAQKKTYEDFRKKEAEKLRAEARRKHAAKEAAKKAQPKKKPAAEPKKIPVADLGVTLHQIEIIEKLEAPSFLMGVLKAIGYMLIVLLGLVALEGVLFVAVKMWGLYV